MATVQRASMIQYPDGQVVIHNIRKKRVSIPVFGANESYSATLVDTWYDGTAMDDSKADGSIYFKLKALPSGADSSLEQYVGSYFRLNLPNEGELFLEKDTMQNMRDLNSTEILLLQMGYFKGVKLNGYYTDSRRYSIPLNYILDDSVIEDDGGYNIIVSGISLKCEHNGVVHVDHYGARQSDNGDFDSSVAIFNCLKSNPSTVVNFDGHYDVLNEVPIPIQDSGNSYQYVLKGLGKLSSGGQPVTVNDGLSSINYYGPEGGACFSSASVQTWVELDSLMIRDRSGGLETTGFKVDHYRSQRMSQVYILGFGVGMDISGDYYYSKFVNCSFTHAKSDNIRTNGLANGAEFDTCRISLSQGRGMYIKNGGDVIDFNNCYVEGNAGPGLEVFNIRNVNFNGGYIEKNGSSVPTGSRYSQIVVRIFNNSPGVKIQLNVTGSHYFSNEGVDLVYCTNNSGTVNGNQCINLDAISVVASDLSTNYNSETPTHIVYGTTRNKIELSFSNLNYHLIENKFKLFNGNLAQFKSVNFNNDQNAEVTFLGTNNYRRNNSFSSLDLVSPIQNADGSSQDLATLDVNNLKGVLGSRIRFFLNQLGSDNVLEFYNSSGEVTSRIYAETGEIEGNLAFEGGNQRVLGGVVAPEGNVSAWQGSLYLRADGINSYLYRKHSGTGNVGWRRIIDEGVLATESQKGVVGQSGVVEDASNQSAPAIITNTSAATLEDLVDYINNSLVINMNQARLYAAENRTTLNNKLTADRDSGQQAT